MSGLTYCLGNVDSQNCANICMQKSDCDSGQPGEICCKPQIGGAFCVSGDGQFVSSSECATQMGKATQCQKIPDKGTIIQWEFADQGEHSVTANMLLSKDDPQYQDYMKRFCS